MIELLAVIVIIGILIAIAVGGFAAVRRQAWRARSRDLARQLCHAWNQHLLSHGRFPREVAAEQDASLDDRVLTTPAHLAHLNTNRQAGTLFFDVKTQERSAGLRDKWGALFRVRLDTDYNGLVLHPFSNSVSIRAPVIIWSDRYGNPSDPSYTPKTEDDIVVW